MPRGGARETIEKTACSPDNRRRSGRRNTTVLVWQCMPAVVWLFAALAAFDLSLWGYDGQCREAQVVCVYTCSTFFFFKSSGGWVKIKLGSHTSTYQIHVVFRFNPRSRCNSSSRCCYRAREHVDPT